MQKNALHLIKGRMPKNDHEILLSRHMMTNGGVEYRVGIRSHWTFPNVRIRTGMY